MNPINTKKCYVYKLKVNLILDSAGQGEKGNISQYLYETHIFLKKQVYLWKLPYGTSRSLA